MIDAPVSTNSLTGKSAIVPSNDRSLGLMTMCVFAARSAAHAEYEFQEKMDLRLLVLASGCSRLEVLL